MEKVIVQTPTFLTLLGAGFVTSETLGAALKIAPILVAADGGAGVALAHGVVPEAVIGDFDSLDPALRHSLPPDRVHIVTEQDSTDFEKALTRVDAPLILGVGFTGKRRDHELAAYHALIAFAHKPCILLAEEDVILLCPPQLDLNLPIGTRVSLFPMSEVHGTSGGLRWPIDGLKFAPGKRIGTSNVNDGSGIRLIMDRPHMLLILPIDALEPLIVSLKACQTSWPSGFCG